MDARPLHLIERFPYEWWWTFALDRCYATPQGRHVTPHTCRQRYARRIERRVP